MDLRLCLGEGGNNEVRERGGFVMRVEQWELWEPRVLTWAERGP